MMQQKHKMNIIKSMKKDIHNLKEKVQPLIRLMIATCLILMKTDFLKKLKVGEVVIVINWSKD